VIFEETIKGELVERLVPETDEDVVQIENMLQIGEAQWAPGFSDQTKELEVTNAMLGKKGRSGKV